MDTPYLSADTSEVKVLIADSNRDFCTQLRFMTESLNLAVSVQDVTCGAKALELLETSEFDILITDLCLPNTDGFTLLSCASKLTRKPRLMVVTAFGSDQSVARAVGLGAEYFFLKPASFAAIGNAIMECCNQTRVVTLDNVSEVELSARVTEIIQEIGIPAHIKGYSYIRSAICLSVRDLNVINHVTKVMYPAVARLYDTTATRVERAIRHSIEVAWGRGDLEVLQRYFGFTISGMKGKPTNSEFVALIADKVRLELRRGSSYLENNAARRKKSA